MIKSRLITFIATLVLSGTVATGGIVINSDKENNNVNTIKAELKEEDSKDKELNKVKIEEEDKKDETKSREANVEKENYKDENNKNKEKEVAVTIPEPEDTPVESSNNTNVNTENVVPIEKPAEKPIEKPVEEVVQKPVEQPKESNIVPDNSSYIAEIEQAIFQRFNQERTAAGLSALSYNTTMQSYARIKSKDMGDNGYFSHEDQQGNLITVQMKSHGISYRAWGENIAYIKGMTGNSALATRFMDNWMNSPGHKANILSTNFSSIGVGVYKIGDAYYATQEFYD